MNLSWLDDFLALAACGNFSRAAQERHMTQPAFSRRIRALEEWLGTDLFDRSSQPARLTAAGEWFRNAARDQLGRVARLPGEAKAVAEANSTTLRFAATHALSFTFMPNWLRGLESHISLGPVNLVSDVFVRCEALMLQSQVQFVLSHSHPQSGSELQAQEYPFICIGEDTLIPVSVPAADGRPQHELLAPNADAPVQVLNYSMDSGMGRILRDVRGLALERCQVQSAFQAHLASVLRTMTLDGRGMAWLPQSLIDEDLRSGRLVEAAPPDWRVDMDIRLYRDRFSLGQAAEAFWVAVSKATS
ncbi:MAG: LysR family transcriptional regulator [Aquabacterium sp.]|nr:LysR family transcriptional regulator [Aquabacterium sp.]MDO9003965.1 LysR family transcriptional regulator [Aquabacterium sp.]